MKPNASLWQAHFSPDGRWIVFEVVESHEHGYESAIYATPAFGEHWVRITSGKSWEDKPRWSPDGRTIYYISERDGYFNVWGRRFDPKKGTPEGDAFPVTSFDSPKMMVGHSVSSVGLSITRNHLVLTITQVSGSIWVLNDVDR